ncbi:pyridine nucleotide-disulfide oxidoreductase [Thalassobacillus devorans]|uniref:Pyridine nucleotide-disulfide oxidoreductase n=1 Tax=Thalassobacillus devorans TaxID=279813 RepID=A0ABQ1PQC4_9BACI|nr:FAD-dependent oxidoreductase [Thalassobacillus devorans]NIK30299.1 NADH dehydrogenase FAD-containing subunit [Thalassobacillus devorans]GGD01351.1 pyridine nucleotide-disulfide oxidoreductase [Thalassobacillus devorans]
MTTKVILVGGGHAHLHLIRSLMDEHDDHVEVLLISRSSHQVYSPMLPGFAEGIYTRDQVLINLRTLCAKAGVPFIQREAAYINTRQRKLVCKDGAVYPFDILSMDMGVDNSSSYTKEKRNKNSDMLDTIESLRDSYYPLIVGEGLIEVELALAIQSYKQHNSKKGHVRLLGESRLLPAESNWTYQKVVRILNSRGVQTWENEAVQEVQENYIRTNKKNKVRFTDLFWHGHTVPSKLFLASNLPIDDNGFVKTIATLQVKEHPYLFAVGDSTIMGKEVKRSESETNAAREGELLWENICHYLHGTELGSFHPQKRSYSVLSTGNGEGLLIYGAVSVHNKKAWKVRDKQDQSYMHHLLS